MDIGLKSNTQEYKGVVSYEILPNGCLNGVFSNNHPNTKDEIYNEIARRKSLNDEKIIKIDGEYDCCYWDKNEACSCDLVIKILCSYKENIRYQFIWYKRGSKDSIIFEGVGWLTRDNELTVTYWWKE